MVPPLEESEERNRASFSRWEKRSVISSHFTELVLEITEIRMMASFLFLLLQKQDRCIIKKLSQQEKKY